MKLQIFEAGLHTDSEGRKKLWTDADLKNIEQKYNEQAGRHEAPACVGHPTDNAPAYGWLEKVEKVGDKLFGYFKDMTPQFKEWLEKRHYKKRSLSLYPDGLIRHVGFLGAVPPALKGMSDDGLPQASFAESKDFVTYEFSDWRTTAIGRVLGRLRDYLIEKESLEKADQIISSYDVEAIIKPPPEPQEASPAFEELGTKQSTKEDDMDKVKELEAQLEEEKKKSAQFSDAAATKDTELTQLKAQLAAEQAKNRRAEFAEFVNSLNTASEVHVPPAMVSGALDFMEILSGIGEFEFAEAEGKTAKKNALDAFKGWLKNMPVCVELSEKATKAGAAEPSPSSKKANDPRVTVDPERQELHEKALAYQEKHPNTSYEVAVNAVMNS